MAKKPAKPAKAKKPAKKKKIVLPFDWAFNKNFPECNEVAESLGIQGCTTKMEAVKAVEEYRSEK